MDNAGAIRFSGERSYSLFLFFVSSPLVAAVSKRKAANLKVKVRLVECLGIDLDDSKLDAHVLFRLIHVRRLRDHRLRNTSPNWLQLAQVDVDVLLSRIVLDRVRDGISAPQRQIQRRLHRLQGTQRSTLKSTRFNQPNNVVCLCEL